MSMGNDKFSRARKQHVSVYLDCSSSPFAGIPLTATTTSNVAGGWIFVWKHLIRIVAMGF